MDNKVAVNIDEPKFTWIPIHKEAIRRILEFRQDQTALLAILQEMEHQGLKVISLKDRDAQGNSISLAEIDPFTFLASFNRGVTDKNRKENWTYLKEKWSLQASVPNDFTGIPTLFNLRSWLFPYAKEREPNHVSQLWEIAAQAATGSIEQIDQNLFDRCLGLKSVAINNLTIGLFWINPPKFLPADNKTAAFAKAKGIVLEPKDHQSYRQWMAEIADLLGHDNPANSHAAHIWAIGGPHGLDLTPERMKILWDRFHQRIKGFIDFENPGTEFNKNETAYKREILNKFDKELGAAKLNEYLSKGQEEKAANEISRLLTSNLVSFHAWRLTLGGDKAVGDVLKAYLETASKPYAGPESTIDIFEAGARHDLKPNWDALSTLLWALRPADYFPIKISFYRKLADDLGLNCPLVGLIPKRVWLFCI